MSCLPCFGKKKDGNADGGGDEQAEAGPMTPPPAVQAPAPYHAPAAHAPVAVAAPASVTPTKPAGGASELASSAL